MARDKSKDDKYFDCSKDDLNSISNLYGDKRLKVRGFLVGGCEKGGKRILFHLQELQFINLLGLG